MKDRNCMHYGMYNWRPRNWGTNIKQFFRNIRYAKQRIARGYCDYDTWEMNGYMLSLTADMLDHLAEHAHGWPDNNYKTYEDWQNALRTSARLLRNSHEELSPYQNRIEHLLFGEVSKSDFLTHQPVKGTQEWEDKYGEYLAEEHAIYEKREADFAKVMDWLKVNHNDLWD